MLDLATLLLGAFLLDLILGDPPYNLHPIRIIGALISGIERAFRKISFDGYFGGIVLVILVALVSLTSLMIIYLVLSTFSFYILYPFYLFFIYSFIAFNDLLKHIKPVVQGLRQNDLNSLHHSIGLIVGRDAGSLDRAGVSRAAVETLAENFVDGFLSPIFWFIIGIIISIYLNLSIIITALSTMMFFKIISTLDSMIGYKNQKYNKFGFLAAKLDDLMNFIPARLSIIILFIGSLFSNLYSLNGFKIAMRDRLKHDSPNAGHAESFVAGALGVRLGGPTRYEGRIKKKPWLGDGDAEVDINHIVATVKLLKRSAWITIILVLAILLSI